MRVTKIDHGKGRGQTDVHENLLIEIGASGRVARKRVARRRADVHEQEIAGSMPTKFARA